MSENRFDQNELMVSYSWLRNLAFGFHSEVSRLAAGERYFAAPELSLLVHRWNLEEGQGNLYAQAGLGVQSTGDASSLQGAGLGAIEGDFETRWLYLSSRVESLGWLEPDALTYARARAGFAPYLADAEGLHTWIILQGEYRGWTRAFSAGPLLRFFYRNFLFELGSDWRGQWTLNWITEL